MLNQSEWLALRDMAVLIDEATARGEVVPRADLVDLANRPAFRGAINALDHAVRWDRAGRVYFALTPAASRAVEGALLRTERFWDDGTRGIQHVRWFLRRLRFYERRRS